MFTQPVKTSGVVAERGKYPPLNFKLLQSFPLFKKILSINKEFWAKNPQLWSKQFRRKNLSFEKHSI